MCGIAGVYIKEPGHSLPVNDLLDYLLFNIEPRGRDAAGYVAVDFPKYGSGVTLNKKDVRATELIMTHDAIDNDTTQIVLAHTRWATQGAKENNGNNHPVQWGSCYIVHNGHINNDSSVLTDLGIEDTGGVEVDSLAIAAALSHHGFGNEECTKTALEMLSGNMATAAVNPQTHPGKLLLAKGSVSPLFIANTKHAILWASTKEAIENAWAWAVGTPVKRKAASPGHHGIYDATFGKAWIIDGHLVRPLSFTPKYEYSRTYEHGTGRSSGRTSSWERPNRIMRYTCIPSSKECVHPCGSGCQTGRCECRSWKVWSDKFYCYVDEDLYEETTDDDDPTTGGSEDSWGRNEILGVNTINAQIRCDNCDDWYAPKDIVDATVGCEPVSMCLDCASSDDYFSMFVQTNVEKEAGADEEITQEISVIPFEDAATDEKLTHYQQVAERENAKHTIALEATAKELGCNSYFVEWLLFQATVDEVHGDQFLLASRSVADKTYAREYEKADAS